MSTEIIKTDKAPAPIEPYNQAVKAGNLLFISGPVSYTHLDVYKRQSKSLLRLPGLPVFQYKTRDHSPQQLQLYLSTVLLFFYIFFG